MSSQLDLDTVMRITDPSEFAFQLLQYVNRKQIGFGFRALTPLEKTVLLANDCEYRCIQGNLDSVVYWDRDTEWRASMPSALRAIGDEESARLLESAYRLLDCAPPELLEAAETRGDLVEAIGAEEFERLLGWLADRASDLSGRLMAFIVANRDGFAR